LSAGAELVCAVDDDRADTDERLVLSRKISIDYPRIPCSGVAGI
jgi:hypothetical protein